MKGFKFRLQSVLDLREKKFEDAQLEFAKAKNKLHQEKLFLAQILENLEQTNISFEQTLNSQNPDNSFLDNSMIFIHQNYIAKLRGDIENQKTIILQAEEELAQKNHLMLEAMKDKKVMEKLKEKAMEDFKANIHRHETIAVDEIATCRHKKTG